MLILAEIVWKYIDIKITPGGGHRVVNMLNEEYDKILCPHLVIYDHTSSRDRHKGVFITYPASPGRIIFFRTAKNVSYPLPG